MIEFGDSALHPDRIPFDYAALYADGDPAFVSASNAAAHKFGHKRWITIHDNWRAAGIIDFSDLVNPAYTDRNALRRWADGRVSGFPDGHPRPFRVYTDMSAARTAWDRLGDLAPRALWWIAVRDIGHQSPAELAFTLQHRWDAPITTSRIWGCQWEDRGDIDVSDLFLAW